MASRGIGGDDGPSLWMFIACILIWGKIQGWFSKAKNSVEDALTDLPNPLQPETQKQLKAKHKAVDEILYKASNFQKGRKLIYYQQIADAQHTEMMARWNIDEDKLIDQLYGLNVDELKAVAKCFGLRDSRTFGFATGTGTIFDYYNELLTDSTFGGDDLTQMRKIWAKTGLWSGI